MTHLCKYHPKSQASWQCSGCETLFCSQCVPHNRDGYPKCTLCRRSLTGLSVAKKIPPFWQKLSSLLLMPFASGPILILVTFSIYFSLLPVGSLGIVLFFLGMILLVEFWFDCMEQLASGETLNTRLSTYLKLKNKSNLLKLILAFSLLVIGLTKLSLVSLGVSYFLSAFFILAIPASLIILMMEKSIFAMLNPVKIGFIIKLFGSAYFLLYSIIAIIAFISLNSESLLIYQSTHWLKSVLINMLTLYLNTCVFLMAGYLVYQYHHELNFTVNRQEFSRRQTSTKSNELAEVDIFIQEGRYEDAQTLLIQKVKQQPEKIPDYKANEKLILLYAIQSKEYFLKKQANQYFHQLVIAGKQQHAADFLIKLRSQVTDFELESNSDLQVICEAMKNHKQFANAIELLEQVILQQEKVENWEKIYLLYAELIIQYSEKTYAAKKYLTDIVQNSRDLNHQKQAKSYLKLLISTQV